MLSQSVIIKKIPALVIVTSQQGLIWRVQGSPQRKLNFLLICTTILIIILLMLPNTACENIFKVPQRLVKMSCWWPPRFKNTVASLLNNCSDRSEAFYLTSCYKLYRCTMHTANQANAGVKHWDCVLVWSLEIWDTEEYSTICLTLLKSGEFPKKIADSLMQTATGLHRRQAPFEPRRWCDYSE